MLNDSRSDGNLQHEIDSENNEELLEPDDEEDK